MDYELFDTYSQKSKKYDKDSCIKTWNSLKPEHNKLLTIGTLKFMAKEDNPIKYSEIIKSEVPNIIKEIFKYGINDKLTASLFYSIKPLDYIYLVENKKWFYINTYGIYQLDEEQINLKTYINKLIPKAIDTYYLISIKNTEDQDQKQKLSKMYPSILKYLGTAKNKIGIIQELCLLYQKSNLYEKMDNINNYLIGFNNGV